MDYSVVSYLTQLHQLQGLLSVNQDDRMTMFVLALLKHYELHRLYIKQQNDYKWQISFFKVLSQHCCVKTEKKNLRSAQQVEVQTQDFLNMNKKCWPLLSKMFGGIIMYGREMDQKCI